MDALQDKRNAKAMAKRDLMRQAKDNMQIVEDNVQQKIVANRDIPKKYTAIVVTHIGSMDGVDEEEPEPRLLTRKEAFALAERDNFDVCFIKEGDNPHTAECRLRYLKLWLRAQVRTQTLAGRKTIEEKLRDQDRRVPISEEVILLRSVTDSQSIATKANEAVLCIKRGKNARIHLKYVVVVLAQRAPFSTAPQSTGSLRVKSTQVTSSSISSAGSRYVVARFDSLQEESSTHTHTHLHRRNVRRSMVLRLPSSSAISTRRAVAACC